MTKFEVALAGMVVGAFSGAITAYLLMKRRFSVSASQSAIVSGDNSSITQVINLDSISVQIAGASSQPDNEDVRLIIESFVEDTLIRLAERQNR